MLTTSKTAQNLKPVVLTVAITLALWLGSKWVFNDWFDNPFKGVSTSLQLFFMTASMAWRPWSQCPDMWSVLFAQPAQQVGEKEALGLLQSGG